MQGLVHCTRQKCVTVLHSVTKCTPCGSLAAAVPAARWAGGCCPEFPPGGPADQCPTPREIAGTCLQQHMIVIARLCAIESNVSLHHTPLKTLQSSGSSVTVPGHAKARMHRANKGSLCLIGSQRNDCKYIWPGVLPSISAKMHPTAHMSAAGP